MATVSEFVAHVAQVLDGPADVAVGATPNEQSEKVAQLKGEGIPLAISVSAHMASHLEQIAGNGFMAALLDPWQ